MTATSNLLPSPHATSPQVHVRVAIPKTLSAEERKLVEQLREVAGKPKAGPFRF